jgi:2-amino-4-hydroxy-6-hydroxymethyldihydropteridine diphosphokinase
VDKPPTLLDAECAGTVNLRSPIAKKKGAAAALGSNIAIDENLRAARKAISSANVKAHSFLAVYETEPIGCEPGAGKFLNAIVEFEYEDDPARLLEQLIQIEEALGRRRDHPQNVSRTIDIDLLYYGDHQINDERLQLPHPRLHLREFVLRPWPISGRTFLREENRQRLARGFGASSSRSVCGELVDRKMQKQQSSTAFCRGLRSEVDS